MEEANKLELEETGAELDPENEQENAELGEAEEHPDYQHLDPGEEEQERQPCIFRRIEVPDSKLLKERTLSLDKFQRIVVDNVVKYAKDVRRAQCLKIKCPAPPHLMVHGGAGAGKTTVIRSICD